MRNINIAQHIKLIISGMFLGGLIVLVLFHFIPALSNDKQATAMLNEKKPLYWVAPMDANYKRDKPGKSPMGMDLIPVYGNDATTSDEGPGTVHISAAVVNNLGVKTVTARYKSLQTKINTVGYVTYDEDKLIHIHPRVQGWVEKLYVKANGDPIEKNQPLYDIYSPELVNAQEELLLALASNNKQLLEAAHNRLIALKFPLKNIHQLKKDKKIQQLVTYYAPQQGVVKQLDIREGFYVKPETLMLTIVDLTQVWVKAEVFEKQSSQVSMGDKVEMSLDYLPNKSWQGRVEHIHPMINPKTRTAIVRLRFDNKSAELKPNMFANISIHTSKDDKPLLIPKEALIRTGRQDRVVLALGEGRFKSIAVTVGRFDSNYVEIMTGLKAGDKVVSSAQFLLDSESSKSSDFQRMHDDFTEDDHTGVEQSMRGMKDNDEAVSSATVHGTVVAVMAEHRMVTIDREAIEKWGRAADRVDFMVSNHVDISLFSKHAYVMFTFEIREGNFIIVSAMLMSKLDDANTDINTNSNSKGD